MCIGNDATMETSTQYKSQKKTLAYHIRKWVEIHGLMHMIVHISVHSRHISNVFHGGFVTVEGLVRIWNNRSGSKHTRRLKLLYQSRKVK